MPHHTPEDHVQAALDLISAVRGLTQGLFDYPTLVREAVRLLPNIPEPPLLRELLDLEQLITRWEVLERLQLAGEQEPPGAPLFFALHLVRVDRGVESAPALRPPQLRAVSE